MNGLLRWGALALAACSLSACIVYPAGAYRRDRYDGPPPRYHHHRGGGPGWGAADSVAPTQALAARGEAQAHGAARPANPENLPAAAMTQLADAGPDTLR